MAYLGTDFHLVGWALDEWVDEALEDTRICLLAGADPALEEELAEEEGPRGYIIRNWFGPFLLGPDSRFLRGRC